MADLVVLTFDGPETADSVLTKLRALKKQALIDLVDACVVVRDADGEIHIKQSVNLTAIGATSGLSTGALVGALAGLLVLNPLAGMALGGAAGAAMGALSGSMSDYGIDDDFIKELDAVKETLERATTDGSLYEIANSIQQRLKEERDRLTDNPQRALYNDVGEMTVASRMWHARFTPTGGAYGAFMVGIGATDMTGQVRCVDGGLT